jgi:hypothetical protein
VALQLLLLLLLLLWSKVGVAPSITATSTYSTALNC